MQQVVYWCEPDGQGIFYLGDYYCHVEAANVWGWKAEGQAGEPVYSISRVVPLITYCMCYLQQS